MFPPIPFSFSLNPIATILRSLFFYAPRTSSITQTRGAGTPTETRATVATVMGYGPTAVLADGQTLLTVAADELRHEGARRVSEGVWSTVDDDGAPIPAATLKGALVEAAATQILATADIRDMTTANWTLGATMTRARTSVGADGAANSATRLTGGAVAATNTCYTTITAAASSRTYSALVKRVTGTGPVRIVQTGTETDISAQLNASGYALVQLNASVLNVAVGFKIDTNLDAIDVDFNQFEAGAYATSRMAATGAARNADVLDDQVASNLTAAAGTVAFTWTPSHDPSGTIALCGSYVDASNYTALLHDGTDYILRKRIAATDYDATLTAAFTNGTAAKISLTWGASGINLAVDGTLGTADTTGIEGVQYGKLPGTAGAYFSTPNATANQFTGDMEFVLKVNATDWTPAASQILFAKDNASAGNRAWFVRINGVTGAIGFACSADGTNFNTVVASSVAPTVADGATLWLKITRVSSTGLVSFFTSDDGLTWDALGVPQAGATGAIVTSTSPVSVGADAQPAGMLTGNIYYATAANSIGGTPVVAFNPADYTNGTTWTSSATGEVYTINGNAAVWPAVKLGPRWQWGADGNGGQQAGAAFKEMYLTPRTMSDAELQAITV